MNWKVALPGKGTSTPVVTKDWIVLTYAHEGQNTVAAYRRNGEPGWIALCGAEAPGKHRNGSGSNASIATDGDHFFAYFKSGHWVGLDHQGHTLWKHHLVEQYGPVSLYWDHGTSPLITSHGVVMARMHEGESWRPLTTRRPHRSGRVVLSPPQPKGSRLQLTDHRTA